MGWRSKKWLDRLKNSQLQREGRLMNSVQAEILARLIDAIEREGCVDVYLKSATDKEGSLEVLLLFSIPGSPGQPTGE